MLNLAIKVASNYLKRGDCFEHPQAGMQKEAMPSILFRGKTVDPETGELKGDRDKIVDFFFEYLDQSSREHLLHDLIQHETIKTPNIEGTRIHNPIKEVTYPEDFDNMELNKLYTKYPAAAKPLIEYDDKTHDFKKI